MNFKSYFESFLELIYPEKNTCLICGKKDKNIINNYICTDCYNKLPKLNGNLCIKCSKPLNNNSDNSDVILMCNECNNNIRYFETVKSLFKYSQFLKKIIYDYKYYDKTYYYKLFGDMLVKYMYSNNYLNFDLIIPVPLHKNKFKARGYNQSELIARYVAKNTNIPKSNCLKRIHETVVQNQLSRINRIKNIKNAFSLTNMHIINKKKILIIDDIYTTGATINECSRILIRNGASNVYGLTIARG